MSADRPDLHTPDHDQWDQGGYCNNLVVDDDGTATVCGYRRAHDTTDHSAVRWTCQEEGCGKSGVATDTLDRLLLHDCKSRGPLDTVSILLIEDTEDHRMTTYKTPEKIAEETLRHEYGLTVEDYPTAEEAMQKVLDVADDQTAADLLDTIAKAIEADRAQRQPDRGRRMTGQFRKGDRVRLTGADWAAFGIRGQEVEVSSVDITGEARFYLPGRGHFSIFHEPDADFSATLIQKGDER